MAGHVAIIGAGVIGRGWATSFAMYGRQPRLFDRQESAAQAALRDVSAAVLRMAQDRGSASRADAKAVATISEAIEGADLIIEAVPEHLATKREVLADIERVASPSCIVLSSTSALLPTELAAEMLSPERFAVAHPFNPSYLLPVVELVPGERTSAATIDLARKHLLSIGKRVITLNREIEGFVGNRLQAALINEAMNLLRLGVATPADIDACVAQALGLRWAFHGPFATMDMNADGGVAEYARKFGASYVKLGAELGVAEPWPMDALEEIAGQLARGVDRESRISERDNALSNLIKLKRELNAKGVKH